MTGVGKWQTVSVRIVNEEEEYERQKQQEIEDQKEEEQKREVWPVLSYPDSPIPQEEKIKNDNLLLDAGDVEDSLSSFDPYNTGIYRGVDISGRNVVVRQEVSAHINKRSQSLSRSWNHSLMEKRYNSRKGKRIRTKKKSATSEEKVMMSK